MAGIPFLTSSYFVGELLIPNLTTATAAGTANIAELQWFIDTYEVQFLKYLMGEDLYTEFAAGIALTVPDAKWTALKAKIYTTSTAGSVTHYFSPAAAYVYFKFRSAKKTVTTESAETSPEHQNAVNSNSNMKAITNWNQMVKACEVIWQWIADNSVTYSTFSDENKGYLDYVNQWGI
jgi:hypothetical protein